MIYIDRLAWGKARCFFIWHARPLEGQCDVGNETPQFQEQNDASGEDAVQVILKRTWGFEKARYFEICSWIDNRKSITHVSHLSPSGFCFNLGPLMLRSSIQLRWEVLKVSHKTSWSNCWRDDRSSLWFYTPPFQILREIADILMGLVLIRLSLNLQDHTKDGGCTTHNNRLHELFCGWRWGSDLAWGGGHQKWGRRQVTERLLGSTSDRKKQ